MGFFKLLVSRVLLLWIRVSNSGVEKITDYRLKRKIIISNQLAFTVGLLPILTSLYLIIFLEGHMFYAPFLVGLMYLLPIILNRYAFYNLSRIYLTVLPTINLMIVSGFLNDKYGISLKISYISIIAAPIVLFDLGEKVKLIFGVLWVVFMYYITDVVNPYIPVIPGLDPARINNLLMINFCSFLSFIIFITAFIYLQRLNFKSEKQIFALYKETQRQKIELENINQTITDSIHYAKSIQTAVLSKHHNLESACRDYFILFKPKDIVSGDFYMFENVNGKLIIVVADCTGHGVPGAFMSMLGISFLTEIIRKSENLKPNEILNELRAQIKQVLNQQDFFTDAKDGIDVAVVVVDTQTQKAEYSGANRPLFIIKNDTPKTIIDLKPDKMPVGIYTKEQDFTSTIFDIEKGDTLYLFSDGYEDQFGGDSGKKMKNRKLREHLMSMQMLPMSEQCSRLEQLHEQWQGVEEQTDDILIVGITF